MTPSQHYSSPPAMSVVPSSAFGQFVGKPYEAPHGCFRLVAQVYREVYGIDIEDLDQGANSPHQRLARLHQHLSSLCVPVTEPEVGDLVLVRSRPWHIGVVVPGREMLHSYAGGAACIERFDTMRWEHNIEGFYRYVG